MASPHATVAGLIRDLEAFGWSAAESLLPGCIVIWERAKQAGGEEHMHAGFYIGDEHAISNSDQKRTPVKHHVTFGEFNREPMRKIIAIYTHPFLQE